MKMKKGIYRRNRETRLCGGDTRLSALKILVSSYVGRCPTLLRHALSGLRKPTLRAMSHERDTRLSALKLSIINIRRALPYAIEVRPFRAMPCAIKKSPFRLYARVQLRPTSPVRAFINSVGQRPTLATSNICRLKAYYQQPTPQI